MDVLLQNVTEKAFNYALRTGISITTAYAFQQCGRLVNQAPRSQERQELVLLQGRLESKIRILSPAIDMIDLISARGNTSLNSALTLTKDIRAEIQSLGDHLNRAANGEANSGAYQSSSKPKSSNDLAQAISRIHALLVKVEDAVPLVNLAITTSGVNLSTKLSGTISPSRLLQSSTFLSAADALYAAKPGQRQQVGPTYTVSLYMLFAGHAWRAVDEDGVRDTTWKEVMHKARLKLFRVPLNEVFSLASGPGGSHSPVYTSVPSESAASEFAYQLVIVEDLDDDRYHDEGEHQYGSFADIPMAGVRDVVPLHEISKIFYADTGKILDIGSDGELNKPVLLLRRDIHADPPRRKFRGARGQYSHFASNEAGEQSEIDSQTFRQSTASSTTMAEVPSLQQGEGRLPADLDPEWMAFEVFAEQEDSNDEDEDEKGSSNCALADAFSSIHLRSQTPDSPARQQPRMPTDHVTHDSSDRSQNVTIKTSLSLLEMLLKLAALQGFRQQTHLSVEDELLNFFLEESSTAGSGPDKDYRARLRHDAVRRVGFDPYDESPIKRRKEEYIRQPRTSPHSAAQRFPWDEGEAHEEDEAIRSIENRRLPVSPSPLRHVPQFPRTTTPAPAVLDNDVRSSAPNC